MSKAAEAGTRHDALERWLTTDAPLVDPLPPYRRCAQAGFAPHLFDDLCLHPRGICLLCYRTKAQIRAAEQAVERARLAQVS